MSIVSRNFVDKCFHNTVLWYRIILVISVFALMSFSFLSEQVPMNNGAGWDGAVYRGMGNSFISLFKHRQISTYYIQKCLPFATVNIVDAIVGINNSSITLVILIYLTLVIAIIGFFRIVNYVKLSKQAEIVAFSLFFFIFPIVKLVGYYPWSGDFFAYTIGIWVYYFFFTKQKVKMLIVSVIGAFVWQSVLVLSVLLYILPNDPFQITKGINVSPTFLYMSKVLKIIGSIAVLGSAITLFLYAESHGGWYRYSECIPYFFQHPPIWVVGISAVCMSVLTYIIVKPLSFNVKDAIMLLYKKTKLVDVLVAVFVYFIVKFIIVHVSDPNLTVADSNNNFEFLRRLFWEPMTIPLKFMEMHLLYYGLLLPLLILFYKQCLEIISNHSLSYVFIFSLILFFGTQTESRFVINLIPFVIIPIAQIISGLKLKRWVLYAIVFFQLYISHFWFHINVNGIAEDMQKYDVVGYLTNKAQRYFFMMGPWQGMRAYFIFSTLLAIVLIFLFVGKMKKCFLAFEDDNNSLEFNNKGF